MKSDDLNVWTPACEAHGARAFTLNVANIWGKTGKPHQNLWIKGKGYLHRTASPTVCVLASVWFLALGGFMNDMRCTETRHQSQLEPNLLPWTWSWWSWHSLAPDNLSSLRVRHCFHFQPSLMSSPCAAQCFDHQACCNLNCNEMC